VRAPASGGSARGPPHVAGGQAQEEPVGTAGLDHPRSPPRAAAPRALRARPDSARAPRPATSPARASDDRLETSSCVRSRKDGPPHLQPGSRPVSAMLLYQGSPRAARCGRAHRQLVHRGSPRGAVRRPRGHRALDDSAGRAPGRRCCRAVPARCTRTPAPRTQQQAAETPVTSAPQRRGRRARRSTGASRSRDRWRRVQGYSAAEGVAHDVRRAERRRTRAQSRRWSERGARGALWTWSCSELQAQ